MAALICPPEDSDYTGAKDRIDDLKERGGEECQAGKPNVRGSERLRLILGNGAANGGKAVG